MSRRAGGLESLLITKTKLLYISSPQSLAMCLQEDLYRSRVPKIP